MLSVVIGAFIAGLLTREAIHAVIVMWESRRNREQAVSDAWRTTHLEESGKSGS